LESDLIGDIPESYDLAFELDTPPEWVKWQQPFTGIRDWPHYEDEPSVAIEDSVSGDLNILQKVADDWLCEQQTPVTAIAWWGSYIGYQYYPCVNPALPPQKPDYFLLEIWTDNPTGPNGYSIPEQKIWEYRAAEYDEVLVGFDKYPHDPSPPPYRHEPVFRYNVRLPEDAWFCQTEENGVYWISIMAVYQQDIQPEFQWGWTNHEHFFNDDAVAGIFDGTSWQWRELFDQTGVSEDMSFMLFTDPTQPCECFNDNLGHYADWAAFGKPDCWCYERNCRGDADGKKQGSPLAGYAYIFTNDLTSLAMCYSIKEPPKGPGVGSIPGCICNDFARDQPGSPLAGYARVFTNDLAILASWYSVKEPPHGPGVPLCPLATSGGEINYYVYPP